jgi:hypothetical protein
VAKDKSSKGGGKGGGSAGGGATPAVASTVSEGGVAGMDRLNVQQRFAVDDYSGTAYADVNSVLRGKFSKDPKYADRVTAAMDATKLLNAAMSKGTLTKDATLYRGTGLDMLGGKAPAVGSILRDKAFLSTSRSEDVAAGAFFRGVMMKIEAPRGTRAVDVSHVSGGHEKEILLPRNTKLKVTSVSTSAFGQITINARVIR